MALFVVRTSCFAPSSTLLHVPVEFAQRKFLRHFSPVSGCLSKLNVLTSRPHILLLLCFRLTPSEQGSNCRSSPHTYAFALLAIAPVKFAFGKNLKRRFKNVPVACSTQATWEHPLALSSSPCELKLALLRYGYMHFQKNYPYKRVIFKTNLVYINL